MTNIILIGNPGAGKSTLLSSLVEGNEIFPSGISIGKGKTTTLQQVNFKGNTYIDTPGLSDVRHRATAASEIERALKMGGKFQVFFVLTLESMRVKPDDLATIKLVLDAVPQIGHNQYSILINKMSPEMVATLNKSKEERDKLAAFLTPPSVGTVTHSIFYIPINNDWIDMANKWGPLSAELLTFFTYAPTIDILGDKVQPIQYLQFEQVFEEVREEIQSLREDNAALRRAMAEQEKLAKSKTLRTRKPPLLDLPRIGLVKELTQLSPRHSLPVSSSAANISPLLRSSSHFLSPRHSVIFIGDLESNNPRDMLLFAKPHNKQAAEALERALLRAKVQVVFIVTVEHDKIKPENLATIKLVLQAAPQLKDKFSVIIQSQEITDATQLFSHYGYHHLNSIQVAMDPACTDTYLKLRLFDLIARTPAVLISQMHSIKYKSFSKVVEQLSKDNSSHISIFARIAARFKK